MPQSRRSLADRGLRWTKLSENAPVLSAEMPDLREPLDEIRTLAQQIAALTAEQAHHMAQARMATAKIRGLAKRADHLRGRVGASLRGKYGFDSTELIRFGFKPRKLVKQDHVDRELEQERQDRQAADAPDD
jgi:hypothetical protein